MYLKHCELIVKMGKNSKRIAENAAKDYTKRYGYQYMVFYHKAFDSYIVHKEEYLKYFIKNIGSPTDQKGQLSLVF